tara:strand:- start:693 stop:1154 length:462 start_codon:yes stop_codon:yes gene_type:complete
MKIVILILTLSFGICSINTDKSSANFLSNQEYITGDDGVIRMYINILGHVKYPGTYLVYDGIDIMSAFSAAGGYLDGANFKKIIIYGHNGTKKIINLNKSLNSDIAFSDLIDLKPFDTIYIEQKSMSKFWLGSNLPAVLLGILNIALTLERTD